MQLSYKFKSYFERHILWHFCEYFMYLPVAVHRRHVWCNVHRNIHYLFTRQMFSVPAVQHFELPHATIQRCSLCLLTQVHMRMPLFIRSRSLCTDRRHTFCRNKACSAFTFEGTHATPPLFSFGMPMLWMPDFQLNTNGLGITLDMPLAVTFFFIRVDNQFAKENFAEIFLSHFAATWLEVKKCV